MPAHQIDFVAIVFHEYRHGLGIAGFGWQLTDNMATPDGFVKREANGQSISFDRSSEYAIVYDTNVQVNRQQDNVLTPILDEAVGSETHGFPDPSTIMLTAFQKSSLSCNSSLAVKENRGVEAPVLFAPLPFNLGGSYRHWDESKFNNTPKALMIPFATRGKAMHDPGMITISVRGDMGWSLCQGSFSVERFEIASVVVRLIHLHQR